VTQPPAVVRNRPLAVTIIGWVYILTGAAGLLYHASDLLSPHPFRFDAVGVEAIRLVAIVSGAFMLRGRDWARWLALAWIACHVVLSAFHGWPQFAVHAVLCAAIAFFLFRPNAAQYFGRGLPRGSPSESYRRAADNS